MSARLGQVAVTLNGVNITNIQVLHNPLSYVCVKRLAGEPWQAGQRCDACEPPIYARRRAEPLPVCIYCWKQLVRFEPPSHYKGPDSEWTHIVQSRAKDLTFMKVTCQTKHSGPRVPRAIPGRLIIDELELALERALKE